MERTNQNDDDEIDLGELLVLVWSKKIGIIIGVVLFGLIGFLYAKSQPFIYEANALVQLEERGTGIEMPLELQALSGSSGSRSATEIEILKSRTVALEAVEELQLFIHAEPLQIPLVSNILRNLGIPHPTSTWFEAYSWDDEAIDVGVLRVPEAWNGLPLIVTKTGENAFSVELPDGTLSSGVVGVPIEGAQADFDLRIDHLVGVAGRQYSVIYNDPLVVATGLAEALKVAEVGRQSSILQLSLRQNDRAASAAILASILDAYVRQNVTRGSATADKSIEFIEGRLPSAEEQVDLAQTALNAYQISVASVNLTFETEQVLSAAADIAAQLNELDLQQAQLILEVTANHPSYRRLEENRKILEEQLARVRDQTQNLPEQQLEVFNLTRDLQVAQEIFQSLLQRRQELQVVRASTIGNIRVIDSALAQPRPVSPRLARIVLLSAVLGLFFVLGTIFIGKVLRNPIKEVQDIEKFGLSVFGIVPFAKAMDRVNNKAKSLPLLGLQNPKDPSIEALRSLRTSLHFGMLDAKSKSIAITSALPNAGKSFISANVAAVIAQSGHKVVVVDCDMRRGVLRKYFDCPADKMGLSDLLANDADLETVLQKGPADNLYFIPAGKVPPNPSELLMRSEFQSVVERLVAEFEYVIFDTPPITLVSDAAIIAKYSGASLIVARQIETSHKEFETAIKAMERAGGKFSGAILNAVKHGDSAAKYGYY